MPEIVIQDNYADQVPSFVVPKLPPGLSNKEPEKPQVSESKAAPAEPEKAKPATEAVVTDTEGADPEQAEPDKETTGKDPEKPSNRRFERRIDRYAKRAAEAEARAEAAWKELSELRTKQAVPDPSAPKMESFTDIEEYAKAKADYEVKQALKQKQEAEQKQQTEAARLKLVAEWTEKSAEAEDKYDDYAEVVGDLKPTAPWSMAIMEAENGADIAYYLGKHIKEAQRITALSPVSQIREIGKLEMKLSEAPKAVKTPSKAPAPITPVTGSAAVSDNEIKPQMPYEEYMKVRPKVFGRR